jgi:MYXO-CTERM domain-containing protein
MSCNFVGEIGALLPNPLNVRTIPLALFFLAVGCGSEPPADVAEFGAPVVGGTLATSCQWPTALSVRGCTATLVHPKLVTLAAHCLGGDVPTEVLFGEDAGRPARRIAVETCKSYPDFVLGKTDVAYCTLATEVRDVPPTPIIMGCETDLLQVGAELTLVGFGFTTANAVDKSNLKRWADVDIRRFVSGEKGLEVGMGPATSCLGDSGGPLYAKLSDGTFRAVGAGSLTRIVDGECAPPAFYTLLHKFVGWMETSSGLDLTPCHDADGTWNPGPDCGGFATAADLSNGGWTDGCNAGATSGASAMCAPSADGGIDANPLTVPVADGPADRGSCECRVGSAGTGRAGGAWTAMLALGWSGFLRRRKGRVRASTSGGRRR